ncbi:ATP-binding protein [Alkalihalobacterium elongatum]|uniref:ATP-binding protein n=1 Tax=Alkalihalobacterium elongatum TaxID=2675466 RepID=UPI001C1FF5B9|nr:ATP-binding protein [Alkalihalobacterium elongatum]
MDIEELLLNFLFIIVTIFFYQFFLVEKLQRFTYSRQSILIGIIFSIPAFFCMLFPFLIGDSLFFIDMRAVPLILSYLYGGLPAGIITSILIIIPRSFLDINHGYIAFFIIQCIIFIAMIYILPIYQKGNFKQRLLYGTTISSIFAIIIVASGLFLLHIHRSIEITEIFHYFILAILSITFTIWGAIYFMEHHHRHMMMKREMEGMEQMKLVSELAASIAHEIRNPMTVVRGFIQMFQGEEQTNSKNKEYYNIMLKEIDRAQYIITDYLSLAKPQREEEEPISVNQLVTAAVEVITPFANLNSISVNSHVQHEPVIYGNSGKLQQCLINIFKNAIEAMPNGGTLQVTTSVNKDKVMIEIADTGIGMTQEELERLGKPFYTTKSKGTGLGMMVCFSIISNMNGSLLVDSKLGIGTTFKIIVPLYKEKLDYL